MRYRDCVDRRSTAFAVLFTLAWSCSQPAVHKQRGEEFQLGQFTLRVTSVEEYSRAHQGVPWEVEVRVVCQGGNRFERMDLGETLSRRTKVYVKTAAGWRDRVWMLPRGDDRRDFVVRANPPVGSKGYTLDIGNPYAKMGEPDRVVIDLGR